MRSVRPITNCFSTFFLCFLLSLSASLYAQENSPYSRYGLGDLVQAQNILNRGMGGIATAYADYSTVNFTNPASYANLKITTLDIGLDYNSRSLRALNPARKFNSAYLIPSYLQIGLPLSKKRNWGMNLGLRPVTRINYDIVTRTRLANIDSARYNYVGNGGTYQAFMGIAYGIKNLNIGFQAGYLFGNKEYTSRLAFLNDSITYRNTNSSDTTRFGGIFFTAGFQYTIELNEKTKLRFAGHGNMETKLRATRNISRETIELSTNTGVVLIDSIYKGTNQKGEIIYPSAWGLGFVLDRENNWLVGAELGMGNWSNYRYYGTADNLTNNWIFRLGAQVIPNYKSDNYWSRVAYRAGAWFGPDIIQLNNKVPQYAFTFGAGLPVRRNVYTNQYTTINTAFEIGFRGNKSNDIRESLFRFSMGLNLSDIWFNKPKYQ